MLYELKLNDVGPARTMDLPFGSRLNIFTGDNGLGKTFILDAAWFALTRTWVDEQASPRTAAAGASLDYRVEAISGAVSARVEFKREAQRWLQRQGRPPITGFVIYARVDGGFAVWDPNRNDEGEETSKRRPAKYVFTPRQVFDGLDDQDTGRPVCNGLIEDWVSWQDRESQEFVSLRAALAALSPGEGVETLVPGTPVRAEIADSRRMPTLAMPYGDVRVTHTSAGARRILTLAYLMVWAWSEHKAASEVLGIQPVPRVVLIVDELEAHLHPKWQREILPALLAAATAAGMQDAVQVIAATHSPLVLASLESQWTADLDRLFALELETQAEESFAVAEEVPFVQRGDVNSWLTSEIFDLGAARSVEAEKALSAARAATLGSDLDRVSLQRQRDALVGLIPETDPLFARIDALIEHTA